MKQQTKPLFMPWYAGLIFSAIVSAYVFHILIHQFDIDWAAGIEKSRGVLIGVPDWLAYQNRLLGPLLVQGIHRLGFDFGSAHMFVQTFAWILNCVLVYVFAARAGRSPQAAMIAVTSFAIVFLFLQYQRFMIWDSLDLLMMTILAYLIFCAPRLRYLIPLFILGTLNRESGLFVALFILIDAFDTDALLNFRLRITSWLKFWTGLGLLLLGAVYIKLVRTHLFVETLGGTDDAQHQLIGNHIQILRNVRDILKGSPIDTYLPHKIAVATIVLALLFFFWSDTDRRRKGAILTLAVLANIMTFGIFEETRTLLPLLPLALFYGLDRWRPLIG